MAPAIGAEEQELPLFHPSPCAYYVQSPSAASHTLSHPASDSTALILSPFPEAAFAAPRRSNSHGDDAGTARHEHDQEASRLALSRYSSSRGSNNSFLTDKKPQQRQVLRVVSGRSSACDDDEDDDRRSGAWRYVKLDPEAPCCCIAFQVAWRVAVSVAIALLVFVVATRPARPGVSFKVGRVERFSLGEGLDGSGVITSFLNCNCSVEMAVENHSRVFSLRLLPPLLRMSFAEFTFATAQGQGPYVAVVGPGASATVRLFVAAQEKPMYAAGRGMHDLLESGKGVPVTITVRSRSRYRVVGSLVRLTYRHDSQCVVYLRRRTPARDNALVAAAGATCSAATL
ncbi:uncharacterized protein [Lolium perenne]|uniref:uncharacterized protein n=1 Tax=Lolium perenne TaxID=4522 RepID=UPI0021EB17C0|nr:uncharacterized protein LOC127349100 [Lolium perenne]